MMFDSWTEIVNDLKNLWYGVDDVTVSFVVDNPLTVLKGDWL